MAEQDKLEQLFYRQAQIQFETYGHQFNQMTDTERIAFVKEMSLALTAELHEALAETGWKGWSTSRHFHKERYVQELVDVFLMLINMFLVLGVHAGDMASHVAMVATNKQLLNIQRQEHGYGT